MTCVKFSFWVYAFSYRRKLVPFGLPREKSTVVRTVNKNTELMWQTLFWQVVPQVPPVARNNPNGQFRVTLCVTEFQLVNRKGILAENECNLCPDASDAPCVRICWIVPKITRISRISHRHRWSDWTQVSDPLLLGVDVLAFCPRQSVKLGLMVSGIRIYGKWKKNLS